MTYTYYDYLLEIIKSTDDGISIDYNDNATDPTSLNTKFGHHKNRTPYKSSIELPTGHSFPIYSAYKYTKMNGDVVEKLKRSDNDELNSFVNRTSIYLSKFCRDENIDTIVIQKHPRKLIKKLAEKLSEKISMNPPAILDIVEKNDIENIKIEIPSNVKNKDRIYVELKKSLADALNSNDPIKIHKIFGKYRHFLTNTQKINAKFAEDISDKRILVLDDIVTSGKTVADILSILFSFNAKDVKICTVFKYSSS
jgi:predicted amidophosphoribosyltransferase